MNNTAKKGDKLVFTGSSYVLSDTLVVNKPIIIGSRENTVVVFNKNKTMIDIQTNAMNIIGLQMKHSKEGFDYSTMKYISSISTSTMKNKYIHFNMKNSTLFTKSNGIDINIKGHIINSKIKSDISCIGSDYWIGHLYKSNLRGQNGIYKSSWPFSKWKGNCISSNIIVSDMPICTSYYKGIIYKSRLYNTEIYSDGGYPSLLVGSGKFTINHSKIISKDYIPIVIGKKRPTFKVIKSKLISIGKWPKYKIDKDY